MLQINGGRGLRDCLAVVTDVFFVAIAFGLCVALPVNGQCVNIFPVAIFTHYPAPSYTNEPVFFDASASYDVDGWVYSYTWNFGDGNVTEISGPEIVHFYLHQGEFNVSLSVMDNLGAVNSTSAGLFVRAHIFASFSYTPPVPHVHELVTFDASNSSTTDGSIVSYAWDFGEGNRSVENKPLAVHSYNEAGAFNVTLNVTSSGGEWDVAFEVVNVAALPKVAPKAAFTWLPTVPEAGEPVNFNASDSTPDGGAITSYAWDFGDNTTLVVTEPVVTHIYQGFGNYVVLLNVTNTDGFSDVANHSLVVVERPVADFVFTPKEPRVCNVVTFNASVSDPRGGQIVSYEWRFDDNSTPQFGVTVTHRFPRMGQYVVSLNVTTSAGLWDVKNVTVKILPHIADLNEDGKVDILDLAIFGRAYGSTPGGDRWNPRADLDGNGLVNIKDGAVIARSFNMCINPFDPP
jgi:PKD repeat protein